jgi:hypothetical protein
MRHFPDLQEHGRHWFDWECVLIDLDVSEVITIDGIQQIARRRAQQRARGTSDDNLPV